MEFKWQQDGLKHSVEQDRLGWNASSKPLLWRLLVVWSWQETWMLMSSAVLWQINGVKDSLEKTLMLGKIEGKRRRGQQRMRWLDSTANPMDMNLSKLGDSGGWKSLVCCSPWGRSQTWLSDWTTKMGWDVWNRIVSGRWYVPLC